MTTARDRTNHLEVARRIEQARLLRAGPAEENPGYSKSEVARAAGITPGAYTQWIDGTTKSYRADNLLRLADYLNVRIEWLLFGEEPMEPPQTAQAIAEIIDDGPSGLVDETLAFLDYQLQKLVASDPVKMGRYLRMIDAIRQDRRRS